MTKLDIIPLEVTKHSNVDSRTLGPSLTVTACGPPRAVTPLWKGLEFKPGRTFLNQGFYAPSWNSLMVDGVEEGMPHLHQPPQKLSDEARLDPQGSDHRNLLEHRPPHH
jgi:hypothetical protein